MGPVTRWSVLLVAALLAAGCPGPELADHACAATWAITDQDIAAGVLYVAPGADGEGTLQAPLSSLDEALAASRLGQQRMIAIAEGYFPAALELQPDDGDAGLTLAGCGSETVLQGVTDETGALLPILELSGLLDGVTVRRLVVSGGHRGILAHGGVGAGEPLRLEGVRIEECERTGLLVEGLHSNVELIDLEVVDTSGDDGLGYGVTLQAGGSAWDTVDGVITIVGGSIERSTRTGLYVDHAVVDVTDLTVTDTFAVDGETGRGVQLQNNASGSFDGLVATGNADAGIFLHMPLDVTITNSTFGETQRATIPGHEDSGPAGDGLCASPNDPLADPSLWTVTLQNNIFVDNGRAGALVEGLTVIDDGGNTFTGNQLVGDGETFPAAPDVDALYVQGGAIVVTGEAIELGGASGYDALEMLREPLEGDVLTE
jgi:hypothetical protein